MVAGPVQRRVALVVSERRQRIELGAGHAEQLAQPGGVASCRCEVNGSATLSIAQQDGRLLLQQTLDALLLAT